MKNKWTNTNENHLQYDWPGSSAEFPVEKQHETTNNETEYQVGKEDNSIVLRMFDIAWTHNQHKHNETKCEPWIACSTRGRAV